MPSPTPTQRTVMQAMRDGAVLHLSDTRCWLCFPGGRKQDVDGPTVHALTKHGWLHLVGHEPLRTDVFTLTETGLAALENTP